MELVYLSSFFSFADDLSVVTHILWSTLSLTIVPFPHPAVIKCPDLSPGPHGEVLSLLGNYMPTNQISFRCEEGYQMDGPGTLTCGGDGQWDGQPPSCQSETCGELPR